ncbi:hypothetical protein B0H11DRAFT_1371515 [Mycena galericulata]|nr:hypothetical protein B0H11DRAFT_1371515 [Mycena galericulata]
MLQEAVHCGVISFIISGLGRLSSCQQTQIYRRASISWRIGSKVPSIILPPLDLAHEPGVPNSHRSCGVSTTKVDIRTHRPTSLRPSRAHHLSLADHHTHFLLRRRRCYSTELQPGHAGVLLTLIRFPLSQVISLSRVGAFPPSNYPTITTPQYDGSPNHTPNPQHKRNNCLNT